MINYSVQNVQNSLKIYVCVHFRLLLYLRVRKYVSMIHFDQRETIEIDVIKTPPYKCVKAIYANLCVFFFFCKFTKYMSM